MSLADDIKAVLRGVVADIGETVSYRKLTSSPVGTRTYSAWTPCTAVISGMAAEPAYDDADREHVERDRKACRISDAVVILDIGDQVKDSGSKVWAVEGIISSDPSGTTRYQLVRERALIADGIGRGGGV